MESRSPEEGLGGIDLWFCVAFKREAQCSIFPNIANNCGVEARNAGTTIMANTGIHEPQRIFAEQLLR